MSPAYSLGATYLGANRCRFVVWAPRVTTVEIEIVSRRARHELLARHSNGTHVAVLEEVAPGTRYFVWLNRDRRLPDPASRFQPEGVHGPSEVVDPTFSWSDAEWKGVTLADCVFYELHVGTYTRDGTFDAIHPHLSRLRDLGVTAIELMPVAQFPGQRNWGYDGVGLYAVQNSYGGPNGLKRFVDACHRAGLAVVLDVVYNHVGPEGNYLSEFAPYFIDSIKTPWGAAINFAERDSDEVRHFFIENALRWIDEFHIDGLRLDAVHAYHDPTPRPFLAELNEAVHARADALGRRVVMIAESNLNDPRIVRSSAEHGLGCDAQWMDDFHHSLHVALTNERYGYYADFDGLSALERSYREGFVYSGQYSPVCGRRHGIRAANIPFERFIVCAQNHDQIGNRMLGDRLSTLVDFESLKLAAGAVLLSPFVPLLFMGEEYGETAPFLYFVDHSDEMLIRQVREGRAREFAGFHWRAEPPDPQSQSTFERSRLSDSLRGDESHNPLWRFHQALLRLRRERSTFRACPQDGLETSLDTDAKVLCVRRRNMAEESIMILNFNSHVSRTVLPDDGRSYQKLIDSAECEWGGPGGVAPEIVKSKADVAISIAPRSIIVYARVPE